MLRDRAHVRHVIASAVEALSLIHSMGFVHTAICPAAIHYPTSSSAAAVTFLGPLTRCTADEERRRDVWSLGVSLVYMLQESYVYPFLSSYFAGQIQLKAVYKMCMGRTCEIVYPKDPAVGSIVQLMASLGASGAMPLDTTLTKRMCVEGIVVKRVPEVERASTVICVHRTLTPLRDRLRTSSGPFLSAPNQAPPLLLHEGYLAPTVQDLVCPEPLSKRTKAYTYHAPTKVIQCQCGLPLFGVISSQAQRPCGRCKKRRKKFGDKAFHCEHCGKILCNRCVDDLTVDTDPPDAIVAPLDTILTTAVDDGHMVCHAFRWVEDVQDTLQGGRSIVRYRGGIFMDSLSPPECWVQLGASSYLRCIVDPKGTPCEGNAGGSAQVCSLYLTDVVEHCVTCPYPLQDTTVSCSERVVYVRAVRRGEGGHAFCVIRLSDGSCQIILDDEMEGEPVEYRGIRSSSRPLEWYRRTLQNHVFGRFYACPRHVGAYLEDTYLL